MDEKFREYKERHIRWQNFTLMQLGYSNNIALTLGIGFLALAFDSESISELSFGPDSGFSPILLIEISTVLSLLISIGFGLLTSMSRLYDFRITRHIALTRQRYYEKSENKPLDLPANDFPKIKFRLSLKTLCRILCYPIDLIDKKEIKELTRNKQSLYKFNRLRLIASILGNLSWTLLRFQFLFLMFSMLLYSVSLFV